MALIWVKYRWFYGLYKTNSSGSSSLLWGRGEVSFKKIIKISKKKKDQTYVIIIISPISTPPADPPMLWMKWFFWGSGGYRKNFFFSLISVFQFFFTFLNIMACVQEV